MKLNHNNHQEDKHLREIMNQDSNPRTHFQRWEVKVLFQRYLQGRNKYEFNKTKMFIPTKIHLTWDLGNPSR